MRRDTSHEVTTYPLKSRKRQHHMTASAVTARHSTLLTVSLHTGVFHGAVVTPTALGSRSDVKNGALCAKTLIAFNAFIPFTSTRPEHDSDVLMHWVHCAVGVDDGRSDDRKEAYAEQHSLL